MMIGSRKALRGERAGRRAGAKRQLELHLTYFPLASLTTPLLDPSLLAGGMGMLHLLQFGQSYCGCKSHRCLPSVPASGCSAC